MNMDDLAPGIGFSLFAGILLGLTVPPEPVLSQDEPVSCLGSSIPFETSTLERIVHATEDVLERGREFWETEKPLIYVQGWADEVRSPNPYERFRESLEGLASGSEAAGQTQTLVQITEAVIARQEEWQKKAIPHICSFFPAEVDLSRPAYFVAFVPPRAFATSEGIVVDVSSDYWEGNPDNILNMLVHEFFHTGFGQLRRVRTETPLDQARLDSMAESIQNEGMAVWVAYDARDEFPAPGEVDNRLLNDPERVAGLRTALNGLFERALTISDDQLRRQGWSIGVTNRAYYVVGAHMARVIQAELGKEALVETLEKGPLSYIRLYNSLVPEEERVLLPGI